MKVSEHTMQQIKETIGEAAEKFPESEGTQPVTDIHIQASQDTGDMILTDDDDNELSRTTVNEWAGNESDTFNNDIFPLLRRCVKDMKQKLLQTGIMKPFNVVLKDDDGDTVATIYTIGEEHVSSNNNLIQKIDKELDAFLEHLMKD